MIMVTKPESPAEFNPFHVTRDLRVRAPTGVRSSDWADRKPYYTSTIISECPCFEPCKSTNVPRTTLNEGQIHRSRWNTAKDTSCNMHHDVRMVTNDQYMYPIDTK